MQKSITNIKIDDILIPLYIFKENRLDVRIALLKDKVTLRLPFFYTKKQTGKNIEWTKEWVTKRINKNPKLKNRFKIKEYNSGDKLDINGKSFELKINYLERKSFSAKLINDKIDINIPLKANGDDIHNTLPTLLSRVSAQYFLPEIHKRIKDLNKKHFNFNINQIRLKYNKSNWGSRSSQNNINISTRLLFAPKDVQDYVFIHELAHFKEMNHSAAFWEIVKKIMPDYKEKEKWLKKNSHLCDF